jgi:hypothetical protein
MKKFTYILLFYFVAFSFAPTIISLLKSKYEISSYYNLIEEEQSQEQKEETSKKTFEDFTVYSFSTDLILLKTFYKYNFISFYNETLNCNFLCNIFIPPPKTI